MYLSMFVRRGEDHAFVDVEGDVDINSATWLAERLLHLLWGSGSGLLIDLSGVTFIDCYAIRQLVETRRRAERQACSVRFTALSKQVERLAQLTGLTGELPVTGLTEQLAPTGPATAGIPSGHAVPSSSRSARMFRSTSQRHDVSAVLEA